jgi:F-type H+-transporting ATPase subunit b
MVDLNVTLVVELVLFLIFLWVSNKVAIQPMLRAMDEREEGIASDREAARMASEQADEAESEYARGVAQARRAATAGIESARREAQAARTATLAQRRREGQVRIDAARAEAEAALREQQTEIEAQAPGVADAIAARLGMGGGAS